MSGKGHGDKKPFLQEKFFRDESLRPSSLSSLINTVRMGANRDRFFMVGEVRRANIQIQGDESPKFKLKYQFAMDT